MSIVMASATLPCESYNFDNDNGDRDGDKDISDERNIS